MSSQYSTKPKKEINLFYLPRVDHKIQYNQQLMFRAAQVDIPWIRQLRNDVMYRDAHIVTSRRDTVN